MGKIYDLFLAININNKKNVFAINKNIRFTYNCLKIEDNKKFNYKLLYIINNNKKYFIYIQIDKKSN